MTSRPTPLHAPGTGTRPVVVVAAGNLEDWLGPLGTTVDAFSERMMGSWLFGYVSALRAAGSEVVVIAPAREASPGIRIHGPTGARLWILHTPAIATWSARALGAIGRMMRLPERWVRAAEREIHDLLGTPVGALARALRESDPSGILVQEYESTRFDICIGLARELKVPVWGTFTGGMGQRFWHRWIRARSLRRATGLLVCAQSEIDRVLATYPLSPASVRRLYYPVDREVWYPEDRAMARAALGIAADRRVVAYHGTIDLQVKGLDLLIAAWRQLLDGWSGPQPLLLMLGGGKDVAALQALVAQLPAGSVRFRDKWSHDRAEIRRHLSAADAYVFPTRADAFGIAVLEAMACGLPVVAARGRGVPDIFPEGEDSGGLVVAPGDTDALAEALRRLLGDDAFRASVAANALRRARAPEFGAEIGTTLRALLAGDQ